MNELYSQLHSPSIIECYNNAGKNGVSLIKIAQKYSKYLWIFNYTYNIFKYGGNDCGIPCGYMRINIRNNPKNMNKH